MQKKLLTLAVAGALAAPGLALAQVEVYGFIHMSVNKFKYSSSGTSPSVSKWDVASHASNYGVRGRENLGGGQTAWFQIENNAPMERSNNVAITPASRNSAVGMQGGWGNLFMGQWTTPWSDLDALWGVGAVGGWGPITSIIGRRETTGTAPNPNCQNGHLSGAPAIGGAVICDAIESAGGVGHPFWRRFSNAVFYQSPVFGGVQIKAAYMTNEGKATANTTTNADPSAWSASVQWAGMGGRVRVGAAIDAHKDFTTLGQTDNGWRVTGGWNFGVADIGLAYETMTYKSAAGDVEAKQMGIGVAVPIGPGAIRGSYAFAKDFTGPGVTAAIDDAGAKTWNLGYDYRFSKRTTVGVGYAVIKNDTDAVFTWTGAPPNAGGASNTPVAGSDPSTFFVSMLHRF
jgi:predicted porin